MLGIGCLFVVLSVAGYIGGLGCAGLAIYSLVLGHIPQMWGWLGGVFGCFITAVGAAVFGSACVGASKR